jgi:hypothetical protein
VGTIVYKEWLPDLPALGNPGLVTANNVEPLHGAFAPFATLVNTGGSVVPGTRPVAVGIGINPSAVYYYAGTDDGIFMSQNTGAFSTVGSTANAAFDFLQYEERMIATGSGFLLSHTVGSATLFSTLGSSSGTAPGAQCIGRIGQFIFAGATTDPVNGFVPYRLQWSGIDNPPSWPTPNSATAIAQQSGEQFLDSVYGRVTGFANGDQFGLAFQLGAVTRISYIGPPAVFGFDKISDRVGCDYSKSIVQVGGITYFMNWAGVFKTDGVTVQNISENKVSEFLRTNVQNGNDDVFGAYHRFKKLIYWTYNGSGVSPGATKMLILNPEDGRFSIADYSAASAIYGTTGNESDFVTPTVASHILGFGSSNTLGSLSGTAGSAVLETGDIEFNEGGRAFLDAIKPHVESSATAPSMGVRIGTRDDLGTTPSYTSTTAAFARTGFANFRSDAKYHRVELNITGNFRKAIGFEVSAKPSGGA